MAKQPPANRASGARKTNPPPAPSKGPASTKAAIAKPAPPKVKRGPLPAKKAAAETPKKRRTSHNAKFPGRTHALELEICRRLSEGESMLAISKVPGMPSESTMREWSMELHNPLAATYARAREIGYSRLADEILEISDNMSRDLVERPDGSLAVDHEHIQRSRLRVDTRKWILAKMLPRIYGERAELVGKDGGPLEIKFISGDENL